MFEQPEEKPKKTINFSCNLDIETENDPWQIMATELGIDRTTYLRKMLQHEFKHKTIYKKLKI